MSMGEQLVTAIATINDVMDPDMVAIRCPKKWFMKPLEGAKLQGIFRMAHRMEPILLGLLNPFISAYSGTKCPRTTVSDIVTCGLLESRSNSILCGSPDGICILTMDTIVDNAVSTLRVRAAVEMKYLSSKSTSDFNRDLLADSVIEALTFVNVNDIGNKDFFTSVRSPAHRGQCLYHCIVLGVEWCLYIIGDDGVVNRVVVIHFDTKVI
jgi:hypothetical protein